MDSPFLFTHQSHLNQQWSHSHPSHNLFLPSEQLLHRPHLLWQRSSSPIGPKYFTPDHNPFVSNEPPSQLPLFPWLEFSSSPSSSITTPSDSPMTQASLPPFSSSHVVCNAPLVAPIPLPYHSPSFLQFELPDIEEDLSHPPYIRSSPKRKRDKDSSPEGYPEQFKRQLLSSSWKSQRDIPSCHRPRRTTMIYRASPRSRT